LAGYSIGADAVPTAVSLSCVWSAARDIVAKAVASETPPMVGRGPVRGLLAMTRAGRRSSHALVRDCISELDGLRELPAGAAAARLQLADTARTLREGYRLWQVRWSSTSMPVKMMQSPMLSTLGSGPGMGMMSPSHDRCGWASAAEL
jgi:hypothetical protein